MGKAQKRSAIDNDSGSAKRPIQFRGIVSGVIKEPPKVNVETQTEEGIECSSQTDFPESQIYVSNELLLNALKNDNDRLEEALKEKDNECEQLRYQLKSLQRENSDFLITTHRDRLRLNRMENEVSDHRQLMEISDKRAQEKAFKHQEEKEDLIDQIVNLKSAENSPLTVSSILSSRGVIPLSTPSRKESRSAINILEAGRSTRYGRITTLHEHLIQLIGQLQPNQDQNEAIRLLLKEYMSRHNLDIIPQPQLSALRSMQITFQLRLSLNKYIQLKRLLNEDGIDFFASIYNVRKLRKEWSQKYVYQYDEKEGTNKKVTKDLAKLAQPKKRGRPPKNASMMPAPLTIDDISEKLSEQKEKRGRMWMTNYRESLTHRIQNALDSDRLQLEYDLDSDRFSCRIAFGGDKSATTTKLSVFIGGTPKGNNVNNAMLLCIYQGNDNADGLRDFASETFEQVDNVREVTVSYCGKDITLKLELYVIGDLNFFYAILGMGGAASNFNCPYCERKKGAKLCDEEGKSRERTIESMINQSTNGECGMKQGYKPILDVHPSRFIPGAMHTTTGVFISVGLNELLLAAKYADYQSINALSLEEEDEDYEGEIDGQRNVERKVKERQENTKIQLNNLSLSLQSTRCAVDQANAAIEILTHIHDCKIEPPKPKETEQRCASPYCLTVDKNFKRLGQKKGNKTVWDWVMCDTCDSNNVPKDFHTACELIISPEHLLRISNEDEGYYCLSCVHGKVLSIPERIDMVTKVMQEEKEAIPKLEAKIKEKKKEQEEWSVAFTSKEGPTQKKLDETFEKKGASMQKFGQRVTGNHMRNLLKEGVPEILWGIVRNARNRGGQLDLWHEFSDLQPLTTAQYLSKSQRRKLRFCISEIQRLCKEYVPHLSMSPKKHILFYHVMDIVDTLPCWGELSDQGVEAVNQDEKRGMEKFGAIRNQERRWREWAKERERKNVMHDMGLDNTD